MRNLARWCYRLRRLVVAAWLAALLWVSAVAGVVGTNHSNSFNLPDTESTRALNLIQAVAPKQSGDTELVVIGTTNEARITDPPIAPRVASMLELVAKVPNVSQVMSPLPPKAPDKYRPTGTVSFATVTLNVQT